MFIAGSAKRHYQLRSEERNSTSASPLQNYSAPPNGAGGVLIAIYKHVTPNGVKPVNAGTHDQRDLGRSPLSVQILLKKQEVMSLH